MWISKRGIYLVIFLSLKQNAIKAIEEVGKFSIRLREVMSSSLDIVVRVREVVKETSRNNA